MIEQIKKLIQEERKIKEAEKRLNARKNKMRQSISQIKVGFYTVDGELWEVRGKPAFLYPELVFRGKLLQESEE